MRYEYVELFAGAGGLSRGLEAAGFHCRAHAEIEPHARAVLRAKWGSTRLDGDVTKLDGRDYRGITLLSGGSPCQDLSVAGKRAGLSGARSGLFYEQVRIWHESEAHYFLWENVHGALSSNAGADFAAVLSALVGTTVDVPTVRGKPKWLRAGVASGPTAMAAWRVLDLQHFGPPQRRVRVFVLAARTGGVDPAEVLAFGEGVCGHPSPREQQREDAAAGAGGGAEARSIGWDAEFNASGSVIGTLKAKKESGGHENGVLAFHHTQTPISGDVAPAIGRTTDGMVVVCTTGDVTHALTHEGADASEDGTGRGTPIVVGNNGMESWHERDTAITLCARDAKGANNEVVGTLDFGGHGGSYNGQDAYQNRLRADSGRPRRLTPLECERLMSWPDHWTATGVDEQGRSYRLSDTARYRLCGNGVGSVQVAWIAHRLMAALLALDSQQLHP